MFHRHPIVAARAQSRSQTSDGEPLLGESAAGRFFTECFKSADPGIETLFVAHLDGGAHCIHLSTFSGVEAGADVPVRAILLEAAQRESQAIVLAHNHPSGDPTPSVADRRATRRLSVAVEAIDVTLIDNLVFGGGKWVSMRGLGLL